MATHIRPLRLAINQCVVTTVQYRLGSKIMTQNNQRSCFLFRIEVMRGHCLIDDHNVGLVETR